MSNPFVAEIRIFGFNFAPKGWAFCDGQILPLSQNTALFSLLGTTYGGDGKSNFALPNMQGNGPIQQGQGPGLSLYDLGQSGGTPYVTLLQNEMPAHTHIPNAITGREASGQLPEPGGNFIASGSGVNVYVTGVQSNVQFNPQMVAPAGGSQPHNNMMPYLTLNFCIALQGVYPARN